MLVKNIGKIFGKKFSREVYSQIGKIFTKKAVNAMTVVLQVAVEVIDYVYESMTWQKDLQNESYKIIDQWHGDVIQEISTSMIPQFKKENYKNVRDVYCTLKDDVKQLIAESQKKHSNDEINLWRGEKQVLLDAVKNLEI